MHIGDLNTRITIQQSAETQSASGAVTAAWSTLATVWAERNDLTGREYLQAQQAGSEITTQFRIRWRSDVTAKMQVVHGSATYSIEALFDREGRRRELFLICKAVS